MDLIILPKNKVDTSYIQKQINSYNKFILILLLLFNMWLAMCPLNMINLVSNLIKVHVCLQQKLWPIKFSASLQYDMNSYWSCLINGKCYIFILLKEELL